MWNGETCRCEEETLNGISFKSQDNITPEELDELECTEEWVKTMAFMEELECDHLIELALRCARLSRSFLCFE